MLRLRRTFCRNITADRGQNRQAKQNRGRFLLSNVLPNRISRSSCCSVIYIRVTFLDQVEEENECFWAIVGKNLRSPSVDELYIQ